MDTINTNQNHSSFFNMPMSYLVCKTQIFFLINKLNNMKKQLYLFGLLLFPFFIQAQNVGIGTTTPTEKLEIKNPLRSTLKISSNSTADTTELLLSNKTVNGFGTFYTDFSIKSIKEDGLFFSSRSDLPANNSANSFVIRPQGNVGIGNPAPLYKLDVNGDINTTGAIRTNGNGGTSGQVLQNNGNGTMRWGDITEFKNYITFTTVGASSWTVPAGVSRICVEAWGGGGGSGSTGSGGGGGYVTAIFSVTPAGSVPYTVGAAGLGGFGTATSGGTSAVIVGSNIVNAFGGAGDHSSTTFNVATGGSFSGSTGLGFYGHAGEAGEGIRTNGYQSYINEYRYSSTGGKGGDAGNTINTGGKGGYWLKDGTTNSNIYIVYGSNGSLPGGGGGGNVFVGNETKNGGQGMIIIHY
jgi:hypothetical protein